MINELIKTALENAKTNGYEKELLSKSFADIAMDLCSCDAEIEAYPYKQVYDAMLDVLLKWDVVLLLNKMQVERRQHRLLDPINAIQFAIDTPSEGIEFLRCWNEGDWQGCSEWSGWLDFKG